MKRFLTTICLFLFIAGFLFAGCDHTWAYYTETSNSNNWFTYAGKKVHLYGGYGDNNAKWKGYLSFSVKCYGLGSGSDFGDTAWNAYVNSGYKLVYLGAQEYISSSSSYWTESTNLYNYLYPTYLNYLRPGV